MDVKSLETELGYVAILLLMATFAAHLGYWGIASGAYVLILLSGYEYIHRRYDKRFR